TKFVTNNSLESISSNGLVTSKTAEHGHFPCVTDLLSVSVYSSVFPVSFNMKFFTKVSNDWSIDCLNFINHLIESFLSHSISTLNMSRNEHIVLRHEAFFTVDCAS